VDKAGPLIKRHFHERDQLIYAIRGVMTIEALGSIWTIPSNYSLWIPANVEHSVRMNTRVEMRTLYLHPGSVDEIDHQEILPFSLKLPRDRRLAQISQYLLTSLDDSASIAELGTKAGLSARSIIRLFPKETGLTLHRWRQQARLMRAFALAEQGRAIGTIAHELGYSTPSAFAKMFRKIFNQSPREVLTAHGRE